MVYDSASDFAKEELNKYLMRNEKLNTLRSMGIEEIQTEEGIDFIYKR